MVKVKILIFGSCVTRDAFAFDHQNRFELVRYFARSSLTTTFNSLPVEDIYTEQLSSAFQRKIVHADLQKEFSNYVIQNDFDHLIIDFIDDRYDFFRFNNSKKALLSAELKSTNFLKINQNNGQIITGFSDEWLEEWKKSCLQFIDLAKKHNFISKIIVNKVFWTNILEDNSTFIDKDKVEIANNFLNIQYDFIEGFLGDNQCINYPNFALKANKNHMWGLSPFHYSDILYLSMLEQLNNPNLRNSMKRKTVATIRKQQAEKASQNNNLVAEDIELIKQQLSEVHDFSHQQLLVIKQLQQQSLTYEQRIDNLTNELDQNQKLLAKTQQELIDVAKKNKAAKESVESTLSFRLGHTLIHSTKSMENLLALPSNLYALAMLAREKKQGNIIKNTKAKAKLTDFSKIDNRFKKQYGFKFISILDEISHTSFESEFKLFPLNKANFESQIKGSTSLGFFIESCWKGNFGAWEYAFTSPNLQHQNAQNLLKALSVAKDRNFPIIFWNKEDPMHYDKFLPISSKCDIIFTTDSNKIKDYQRDVPSAKVETLMFAANIRLCNPANRFRYESENICFAGSYYGVGHDDRKKQMDELLPTIIKFKGAIYDRMSNTGSDRYAFPKKYRPFIRPAVPFKEIIDIYKQFKIFLNVNTITDSPTMMSRRVYELLACGTPVISTPSMAIDEQFKGIVQVAKNAKEANAIAKRLLENEWEWLRLSHRGYREVMLKHTYEHRAVQIANALGQKIEEKEPLASVVLASNRPQFIDRIVKNIGEQIYPNMEVIVIAQKYNDAQLAELEDKLKNCGKQFQALHIIRNDSEDTLGKRLNQGIALSKGDYVAKFDDDDFYFPNYLQDMLIPFKFGDYGVVGKKEIFVHLESEDKTLIRFKNERHREVDFVAGPTLIFSKEALKKLSFGDLNRGEDSNILEQAKSNKIKIYAADPFNFVQFRSKNVKQHTWQVEDEFFTNKGISVGQGLAEEVTVV